VAGDESAARWIVGKLRGDAEFSIVDSMGSGFLRIAHKDSVPFTAAVTGAKDVVTLDLVSPLFGIEEVQPEFVVNVPSKAIWHGTAIEFVHDAPAAFGTLGDLVRASRNEPVSAYRNKEYSFFELAFRQHTVVRDLTRLYDRLYQLHRHRGLRDITAVLVDAYDVSSEDIRHAHHLYGRFDAAVKMTSYGSITTAAKEAAESMGAGVFKFGEFLGRLNKP
jgi:hypothetical protein